MKSRIATAGYMLATGLCFAVASTAALNGPLGPGTAAEASTQSAVESLDGCTTNVLEPNDDGSSNQVPLPFTVNFFGTNYQSLYVNNNGNVTFDSPKITYTPYTIDASVPPMIAPFFADVDTRTRGSVSFGATTFNGFPSFCVNWSDVGYYRRNDDKTNTFQLILVSRPDVSDKAFDIVFNYDRIEWETGDWSNGDSGFGGVSAGAGFSNGDGQADHFFQIHGSLEPGSFLDTNSSGLTHKSFGSTTPGRYYFNIRSSFGEPDDLSGLERDFPNKAIGYHFWNLTWDTWLRNSFLANSAFAIPGDFKETFADVNVVPSERVCGWGSVLSARWCKDENPALESQVIKWMEGNGGMCFGMALSGARFDAGLNPLADTIHRTKRQWRKSRAFELPEPMPMHGGYNLEFLRMLLWGQVSQSSVESVTSQVRQLDAFSDVTNGFYNFRRQLVSVLKSGKNLYPGDYSSLDTPGNKNLALVGLHGIDSKGRHWGHAVVAYSLKQETDGTLTIGTWDSNQPNKAGKISVFPTRQWTYDALPLASGRIGLSASSDKGWVGLIVLPLFAPSGLHLYPQAGGSKATLGTGAFMDLPAGSTATVVDSQGKPTYTISLATGEGSPAQTVTLMPSGSGQIRMPANSSYDIRGPQILMSVTTSPSTAANTSVDTESGTASVTSGAAALNIARGTTSAASTGATSLSVQSNGNIMVEGNGAIANVTVSSTVSGQQVVATVFNGKLRRSKQVHIAKADIKTAIAKAAPKDQKIVIKTRHSSVHRGASPVISGSFLPFDGVLTLERKVSKRWVSVAQVRATGHTFSVAVKGRFRGSQVFRVTSPAKKGFKASSSKPISIMWPR